MSKHAKHAGFTLLETMLVMALVGLATLSEMQQAQLKAEQLAARDLGRTLFEYNNGVRRYITEYQGQVTSGFVPAELQGQRSGVNWLKSASCDAAYSADRNFVDCNFLARSNGRTPMGNLKFETYFNATWNAGTGQAEVEAVTVMVDDSTTPVQGLHVKGTPRPDLSGLAATVVGGIVQLASSPMVVATDGDAAYCISTATKPGLCDSAVLPAADYAEEKIVLRAGNFGGTNPCLWMRTDGMCDMQSDFTFSDALPFDNRELLNVSRILGTAAEGIQIGAAGGYGGGAPAAGLLVVDANMSVWQDVVINNSNLDVVNGRLEVAAGAAPGSGEIEAHSLIDRDDNAFLVDPDGTSVINTAQAARIENNPNLSNDLAMFASGEITVTADTGNVEVSAEGGASNLRIGDSAGTGAGIELTSTTDIQAASETGVSLSAQGVAPPKPAWWPVGWPWNPVMPESRIDMTPGSLTTSGSALNVDNTTLNFNGSFATFDGTRVTFDSNEVDVNSSSVDFNTDIGSVRVNVGGTLTPLSELIPEWLHKASWLAENDDLVRKPTCRPGWAQKVNAIPISMVTSPMERDNYTPLDIRTHWEIYFENYSGTYWRMRVGSEYPTQIAALPRAYALVNTYCYRNI